MCWTYFYRHDRNTPLPGDASGGSGLNMQDLLTFTVETTVGEAESIVKEVHAAVDAAKNRSRLLDEPTVVIDARRYAKLDAYMKTEHGSGAGAPDRFGDELDLRPLVVDGVFLGVLQDPMLCMAMEHGVVTE